jgi:hypothetical protein
MTYAATSIPESSTMAMCGGQLIVITRRNAPTIAGGACGCSYSEFNLTEHLRLIIREELADRM